MSAAHSRHAGGCRRRCCCGGFPRMTAGAVSPAARPTRSAPQVPAKSTSAGPLRPRSIARGAAAAAAGRRSHPASPTVDSPTAPPTAESPRPGARPRPEVPPPPLVPALIALRLSGEGDRCDAPRRLGRRPPAAADPAPPSGAGAGAAAGACACAPVFPRPLSLPVRAARSAPCAAAQRAREASERA